MTEKQWEEMTKQQRKEYVDKKSKLMELCYAALPAMMVKFFDADSDENLDEKLEVLTRLADRTITLDDVPDLKKILELMPDDGQIWD